MKDKLTKKRIKVDYSLVISIAGYDQQFLNYIRKSKSKVSLRRLEYAFCKMNKINVDFIYQDCLNHGFKTYEDYIADNIRIANDHSWIED